MPSAAFAKVTDSAHPIRVMIVDDSLVVRGIVSRWLQEESDFEVVATHRSAKNALEDLERSLPDVVILDIEMPDMDGVTALPLILDKRPHVAVIIASSLTMRNAELSMRCLALGAMDCLAKPQSTSDLSGGSEAFRHNLVERVRALGTRAAKRLANQAARRGGTFTPVRSELRPATSLRSATPPVAAPPLAKAPIAAPRTTAAAPTEVNISKRMNDPVQIRRMPRIVPKALVIGSSTGGPQALAVVVTAIKKVIPRVPVLITQHMPPSFTTILAEHLGRAAEAPCHEPTDGELIKVGRIYVAPGGFHMKIANSPAGPVIKITDEPPVNFCKPAVDPMFNSALQVYGPNLLAVVLTGMGADGARGALQIADAGGAVVAQNEETSVVWGMPGATAHLGACSAILPLDEIGPQIVRIVTGAQA
ncbi:protein-glutamate methylesterase/protein-glutamine glutaminase [Flaviflagellibacter deserti]|uniref:Protein-glutamate methylesterase/protein-glutamine glutaminase n=1 Tax=Flaviflagellibacter deserti TaxID=2267266 RepID=A0ABV9YXD1_9HYPH